MQQKTGLTRTVTHIIFGILFVLYLLVGFAVYRDYGVPIDEYSQIELGRVNFDRITYGSSALATNYDRYYGPVFEVILHASSPVLQSALHIDYMSSRHLGVFLFFAIALICFYLLLGSLFGHPLYGAIGALLLVFSPRIFAESFYNTKDIPFLCAVIIMLLLFRRALSSRIGSIVFLSLSSGFANAIRPQGLFVMGCISLGLYIGTKAAARQRIGKVLLYIIFTLVTTFILFPVFWDGGAQALAGYWQRSASPVGVPTLYFGRFYTSPNIPWHYLPVIIGITTPISVVLLTFTGIVTVAWLVWRRRKILHPNEVLLAVIWTIAVGSVAAAIVFHARTYDGWRHLYYIYPAMIGLSLYVIQKLIFVVTKRTGIVSVVSAALLLFVALDVAASGVFMVGHHPYEYVYFNALAGGYAHARKNFDFDYWGISYKQLLEHTETLPPAPLYIAEQFPYVQAVMIPALQKRGFTITHSSAQATLAIIINRYDKAVPSRGWEKIYSAAVENADLGSLYARTPYARSLVRN